MTSVSSPYNFLEDPELVSRLKRRSLLVIFGARGLISGGSINDADLSERLRKLRSLVPDLRVWHLFDQPDGSVCNSVYLMGPMLFSDTFRRRSARQTLWPADCGPQPIL